MQKNASITLMVAIGALVVGFAAVHIWNSQSEPSPAPTVPDVTPDVESDSPESSTPMDATRAPRRTDVDLEMELLKAQARARELEAELALARSAEDTETEAPPQPEPSPAESRLTAIGGMLKEPAMKDALRAQQKALLSNTHGSLLNYLQLPPEKLEAFKELQVERNMALMDASLGAFGGGASADEQAGAALRIKELNDDYNSKIRTLLGEEDYAVYEEFEKTQPERMQVDAFKQTLGSDNQLTEEQEHELIVAMHEERTSASPSSSIGQDGNFDPSQLTAEFMTEQMSELGRLEQRYSERAKGILSEPQFQKFEETLQRQRAMQEVGMKMAVEIFTTPEAQESE